MKGNSLSQTEIMEQIMTNPKIVTKKVIRITQVIYINLRRGMEKKKSKTCDENFQENNQNFEKENCAVNQNMNK